MIAALTGGHAWAADLAVNQLPPVPAPAPVVLLDWLLRRRQFRSEKWARASDSVNVAPATAFDGPALPSELPRSRLPQQLRVRSSAAVKSAIIGRRGVSCSASRATSISKIGGLPKSSGTSPPAQYSFPVIRSTVNSRWQASLRGRLGYAADRPPHLRNGRLGVLDRRQGRGKFHSVRRCSRNLGDPNARPLLVAPSVVGSNTRSGTI